MFKLVDIHIECESVMFFNIVEESRQFKDINIRHTLFQAVFENDLCTFLIMAQESKFIYIFIASLTSNL